ncbi:MAG: DUF1015 family protein [Acidobacteriota bacterium]
MATVRPFRALRPRADDAARVAAVPYDVVTTGEARELADGNPLSFLRVSRPELELPPGADPYSDEVYQRAAANFDRLSSAALTLEDHPRLYFYRLRSGAHEQVGLAGCYSLDEYDSGIIRKHERTRRDKEDDRTRHMLALGAQTGPVFLVYRAAAFVDAITARVTGGAPLIDFEAADGVRHTLWTAGDGDRDELIAAFGRIPVLYIADGHHRAASAARARDELRQRPAGLGAADADAATFLAVAFPHDQVRILPYNRIVKDLGSRTPGQFVDAIRTRLDVTPGSAVPSGRGEIAMYLDRQWYALRPRTAPDARDPIASLDVSVLQTQLLEPVLGIGDVRTDKRIDFVGGARGAAELVRLVDSGAAAVGFSLHPVGIDDLMAVADAGEIMPPKSTWFEPKLRDGLLIHMIFRT